MKIIIPILCLFISLHPVLSQTKDSISLMVQQYDYHGALRKINAMHQDSLDTEMLFLKATSLKALSKFPEAIACYDSVYRCDSSNLRIALELADCYKSVADMKKAREIYEHALLKQPDNKYLKLQLAGTYMTLELYKKANLLYLDACNRDTSAFLLKQIATCFEKLGSADSAMHFYQRAIYWNPGDYQPVFRLATMYKSAKEYEKGIAVTDSFLVKVPLNKEVTRLCAYLYYLNKNLPKAIERFNQSINLSDTSDFVNKYLGYSYFKLNEFPSSIKYLEKVYAVDSSDAEMGYALGLAHDPPKSIRYFNAAINLTSPAVVMLSTVYQDLALALTKDWKYDEALAALMKALELTPRDPAVLYKIGVHYDNWMDNRAMAVKYYSDFLATRNGNTDAPYVVTSTSVVTPFDYTHAADRIRDIETALVPRPPSLASDSTSQEYRH